MKAKCNDESFVTLYHCQFGFTATSYQWKPVTDRHHDLQSLSLSWQYTRMSSTDVTNCHVETSRKQKLVNAPRIISVRVPTLIYVNGGNCIFYKFLPVNMSFSSIITRIMWIIIIIAISLLTNDFLMVILKFKKAFTFFFLFALYFFYKIKFFS